MQDYTNNISHRRNGFLWVLLLLLLYNEGEIHIIYHFSPYLYKASHVFLDVILLTMYIIPFSLWIQIKP